MTASAPTDLARASETTLLAQYVLRYVRGSLAKRYGQSIKDAPDRLFLRCTNCGVIFLSSVQMPKADFEEATIEDKTYKCPVCANFDTYGKSDLFYDPAQ